MKKGTLMRKWMLRVIGLLVIFAAYLLLEEYVMQVHGTSLAGRLSPDFGKDRQRRAVFPPDR